MEAKSTDQSILAKQALLSLLDSTSLRSLTEDPNAFTWCTGKVRVTFPSGDYAFQIDLNDSYGAWTYLFATAPECYIQLRRHIPCIPAAVDYDHTSTWTDYENQIEQALHDFMKHFATGEYDEMILKDERFIQYPMYLSLKTKFKVGKWSLEVNNEVLYISYVNNLAGAKCMESSQREKPLFGLRVGLFYWN